MSPSDSPGHASGAAAPLADLLGAALDSLPAHVCIVDSDGVILWINRAWRDFGIANDADLRSSGVGSNYFGVCAAAGAEPRAPEFAAMLRGVLSGQSAEFETEYACASKTEVLWFAASVTPMPWKGGTAAVVAHHPITARKRAEVVERQAHKLEALGALAGGIAHDFNNILSVILGNAAMLDEPTVSGVQRERLQLLRLAAQRARELVQRILAFASQQPHLAQRQPLAPLLDEALAMLRSTLPATATLERRFAAAPVEAVVDRVELEQVLFNLCTNAWHALSERPGRITVGLELLPPRHALSRRARLEDERSHAHLWVQDSGAGMDAQTQRRVFEPFFTTKPAGQGSGLGLAVVRGIVRRQGGAILVDSQPGQGSTFHVLLPGAGAGPAEDATPPAPPAPTAAEVRRGAELLLVDDDDVVGITIEALLAREGYTVTRLREPAQVLGALRSEPERWQLLLSDQNMPDMSGLDLARETRRSHPALPVLLMSGYISETLRSQAEALGVRALVPKERVIDELMPVVRRVLGQDSRVTPPSAQA